MKTLAQWVAEGVRIMRANAEDHLDREFLKSYFKQLVGRYRALLERQPDTARPEAVEAILKKSAEEIQWDDLYLLEVAIIRLEPEDELRRHAWALRAEYERLAPEDYARYMASTPPDPEKAKAEELRADMVRIQEELNWIYTVLWVQESWRALLLSRATRKAIKFIVYFAVAGIGLMLLTFFFGLFAQISPDREKKPDAPPVVAETQNVSTNGVSGLGPAGKAWQQVKPTIPIFGTYWLVMFAGILGALISVLRRIQGMTLDGNADMNLVQLERTSSSIYYSPLLGAVFALLLMFFFMGGLLSGSLFPAPGSGVKNVFLSCVPAGCGDLAKLIIWSFIAGFAEKFVPDALDKLQGSADTTPPSTSVKVVKTEPQTPPTGGGTMQVTTTEIKTSGKKTQ